MADPSLGWKVGINPNIPTILVQVCSPIMFADQSGSCATSFMGSILLENSFFRALKII
ncbi:MAG: hypothetical protein AWT59_3439 [Candidatus Gallionella acididurans]|uniref:Uncharacterized protein n=1 Tax=Candidatus Gallionella acididurans TaxID=1796491 RepID=A0A139BNC2_9PROT|nr:MAG: hypothetical protein AWT59_3439 [Candidatus Gallionella acididurans]